MGLVWQQEKTLVGKVHGSNVIKPDGNTLKGGRYSSGPIKNQHTYRERNKRRPRQKGLGEKEQMRTRGRERTYCGNGTVHEANDEQKESGGRKARIGAWSSVGVERLLLRGVRREKLCCMENG